MTHDDSYHPIIYIRGYAGTEGAVEETVATPYMGFNLGSTKIRQGWKGGVLRHIFESPLVRLMKDHDYRDVYESGQVIDRAAELPRRSLVIYRYYDSASGDLGDGKRREIEQYAMGLSELIEGVKQQVCAGGVAPEDFRVHIVAHSLGGLICRAFLQNEDLDPRGVRDAVDKVFTYATPHNGIDLKLLGNVPGFFTKNNVDSFNRDHMREYMKIGDGRANSLDGKFPTDRFFCLAGTNCRDYAVAGGWSTRVVGDSSDGLVRIENASVRGAPRAFVHRSHSGHYGIVNSEEGYQNLCRFLFGDVRVDARLVVDELTLPSRVQRMWNAGHRIRASYHFESVVRVRGARYDLHRRVVAENSAVFRTYEEMFEREEKRHPYLFSLFLRSKSRTRDGRGPLVFAVDLAVKVPDYEIDRRLWFDDHIEGGDIYRKTLVVGAVPPDEEGGEWTIRWGENPSSPNPTPRAAERSAANGVARFSIPVRERRRPGISARLELTTRDWS